MEFMWLGQGGYLFRSGGVTVAVDPYLSDELGDRIGHARLMPPPIKPEELRPDYVYVTYEHADHLDPGTLKFVSKTSARFIAPESCRDGLYEASVKPDKLKAITPNETLSLGDMNITAAFADHTADAVGVVFEENGLRVYLAGDTLYTDDLARKSPRNIDILICCINGKWGNMNGAQALSLAKDVGASLIIPSHYGMFPTNIADPRAFEVYCRLQSMPCFLHKPVIWYNVSSLLP